MKKNIFNWLGLVAVGVVALDLLANWGDWTELLWFCTVTTMFLSVALFRKNAAIMTVCLILSIPAQSVWVFDFILNLFGVGMGRTALLERCGPLIYWGSIIIHTFVIPVAWWGVQRLGFYRGALGWAMGSGALLLVVTYFVTPEHKNVNCVFFSCDSTDPGGGYDRYFLMEAILRWAIIVPLSYSVLAVLFRKNQYSVERHANNA